MRILMIAAAAAVLAMPAAGSAKVQMSSRTCYAVGVAAFTDRVHVQCAKPPGPAALQPARFFAVPTTDPLADKVMAIATEAMSDDRALTVWYDDTASANPPGCAPADCRRLLGLEVVNP